MLEKALPSQELAIPRPSSRSTWLFRALYLFMALWVIAVLAFNVFQPIKVLPRVTLAPGFVFRNQDGERKTSEDYRGKVTVYNFTYSNCVGRCPQTTLQMQSLRAALDQASLQNLKVTLVTISLDPERDTPEVLSQFAAPYRTGQTQAIPWDFLTGDSTLTRYVVGGGFGVYYKTAASDKDQYSVQYEPRFVLVDGWGIIRAEYRTADLDIPLVIRDIGYLDKEVQNSTGVARYAYEAAHLFKCYP